MDIVHIAAKYGYPFNLIWMLLLVDAGTFFTIHDRQWAEKSMGACSVIFKKNLLKVSYTRLHLFDQQYSTIGNIKKIP